MKKSNLRLFLKAGWLWLLTALVHFSPAAQTTNISGIVNTYHAVIEIRYDLNVVRVTNAAALSSAFKIMLVQMKGATYNSSSTSSATFGDTTAVGEAGNYEIAYVCYVSGDSIYLVHNLRNTYNFVNGKVQVVQFGHYANANVTDTIKAKPWDNTTGTGGVIALSVEGTLTLNAPVYGDSSGFRGGRYIQTSNTCLNTHSSYAYNGASTPTQNGAYKGEGIADFTATSHTGGRGAVTNGGGGGNNHNNSGGGGANLTAGGLGGGNSSNTGSGCYATYRGEAGRALSSWGGRKIFSGGGGGAGHNNGGFGTLPSFGGNGGGIVFVNANTLVSNGRRISANGGRGGNSISDGAGGGGGGGTMILDIANYSDAPTLQANGGVGGTADDAGNLNKCFGGGGGGGGGTIYFTGSVPGGVSVTAGNAGPEVGRHNPSCAAPQPAAAGLPGITVPDYDFMTGLVFATTCGTPLPVTLVSFKAKAVRRTVQLSWKILEPELVSSFVIERMNNTREWQTIAVAAANETQESYTVTDMNPGTGNNIYRLKVIERNNSFSYSPLRNVFIHADKDAFSVYPNPATDRITVTGQFSGAVMLKLVDVTGKLVMQQQLLTGTTEVALPKLPKGVYVLRVNDTTRKLIMR